MRKVFITASVCAVAALGWSGSALAGSLIPVGQPSSQTASGAPQQATQSNDSQVTQKQGNGNLNISPALSLLGGASTKNEQGNGNTAVAGVGQSNSADQSQSAEQQQSTSGCGCTSGGEQSASGAPQQASQSNSSDVEQKQGNGNVNVSPAVAVFGDAKTSNEQGNGNTAVAGVGQQNRADQSQSAEQTQSGSGGGEQSASAAPQQASQSNSSDVEQKQGNGNVNVSPAISVFGDASTKNAQGNGNEAVAVVGQSNKAAQSQSAEQKQGGGKEYGSKGFTKPGCGCEQGGGEQSASGAPQQASQSNESKVTQKQGNGNWNISPAVSVVSLGYDMRPDTAAQSFGGTKGPEGGKRGDGTSTWNAQGNGNTAIAVVGQSNKARQSQSADQKQGGGKEYGSKGGTKPSCGCEQRGGGEQSATGAPQQVSQSNASHVTQKQGNRNWNISPAITFLPLFGGGMEPGFGPVSGPGMGGPFGGRGASTWNAQGNGNEAVAVVGQSNKAWQSQSADQKRGGGKEYGSKGPKGRACEQGGGAQDATGAPQQVSQSNESTVTQKQGNGNWNISPAVSLFSFGPVFDRPTGARLVGGTKGPEGGKPDDGTSTWNAQGNGNDAVAHVGQRNAAGQSQEAWQLQEAAAPAGCNRW